MASRTRWLIACGAVTAVSGLVLVLAPSCFPFRAGNAADLWRVACSVAIGPKATEVVGTFYVPRDGWVVYSASSPGGLHFHGEPQYRVRLHDIEKDLPTVIRQIEATSLQADRKYIEVALHSWRESAEPKNAEAFLKAVRHAKLSQWLREDAQGHEYALEDEAYFDLQWQRSRRYWVNIVFELAFLNGLLLFALWPWLRRLARWRWALHTGLLPILFMLPAMLGYSVAAFTSLGPRGGILYPILCMRMPPLPWTSLDDWIAARLPPLLHPLNQLFAQPLSVTGRGAPNPVGLMVGGLVLASVAWFGRAHVERRRARSGGVGNPD